MSLSRLIFASLFFLTGLIKSLEAEEKRVPIDPSESVGDVFADVVLQFVVFALEEAS